MLRIIGVKRDVALAKYAITDIKTFVDNTSRLQVDRVLSSSSHA
jgi:hypothetical protein